MALFLLGPDPAGQCCDCAGRANPCDNCGGETCGCFLDVSIGANDPEAFIADNTTECFAVRQVFAVPGIGDYPKLSFSASNPSSTSIIVTSSNATVERFAGPAYGANAGGIVGFTIPDNTDISITLDYSDSGTLGTNTFFCTLQAICPSGGTSTRQISSFSGSQTLTFSGMSAGQYRLNMTYGGLNSFVSGGSVSATFSISLSNASVVVPAWIVSSSGTFEACPKMYIPPLTESSGSWYASLSAAQAIIAGNHVANSNCIAYILAAGGTNFSWFTAWSFSGFTLSGSRTTVGNSTTGLSAYISVNGMAGATLTWTWTNTPQLGGLTVYDYDGSVVFTVGASSSAITSSALPYTGRYIVLISFNMVYNTSASGTLSSSASLGSANQIQALYDVGLDCPARLNC